MQETTQLSRSQARPRTTAVGQEEPLGATAEWPRRVDSRGSIRVPRTAGIGTKPDVLDHAIERQDGVDCVEKLDRKTSYAVFVCAWATHASMIQHRHPAPGTPPPYVFVLLAYLVWQGVLPLRTGRRAVWRMLIVSSLFTATGLLLLVLRPSGGILPMAAWLLALVAFVPLGLVTGPRLLAVDRGRGRLTRAGSPVPLVRNLLLFARAVWNRRRPLSSPGGAGQPRRSWAYGFGHFCGLFHWLDDCIPASLPGNTRCCAADRLSYHRRHIDGSHATPRRA